MPDQSEMSSVQGESSTPSSESSQLLTDIMEDEARDFTSINELPVELLQLVLSYLTADHNGKVYRSTCKLWNTILTTGAARSLKLLQYELEPLATYSYNDFQHLSHLTSISLVAEPEELSQLFSFFDTIYDTIWTDVRNLRISIKKLPAFGNISKLLSRIRKLLSLNRLHLKTFSLELVAIESTSSEEVLNKFMIPIHDQKWDDLEFLSLTEARIAHPPANISFEDFGHNLGPLISLLCGQPAMKSLHYGTLSDNSNSQSFNSNDPDAVLNPALSFQISICLLSYNCISTLELNQPSQSAFCTVITPGIDLSKIVPLMSKPKFEDVQVVNQSTSLNDYSISLITGQLQNLTKLKIENQAPSCPAKIGDCGFQQIFRELAKLETLELSVNMEFLTDCGLTGLSPTTCTKYRDRDQSLEEALVIPAAELTSRGHPVSALTALRRLVLKGVGKGVTNLTLLHGIRNLEHLRECTIQGDHKITKAGISFWRAQPGVSYLIRIKIK